jgi:flagella basal body P-ring formation protein FlgA
MARHSESMSMTPARYAGMLVCVSLLPLSMLLPLAAAAQTVADPDVPGSMIMIPGNGEPGTAVPRGIAQRTPQGMPPARSADADAVFENAARNAQIVIPGNGEPGAQAQAPGVQAPVVTQTRRPLRSIQYGRTAAPDPATSSAPQPADNPATPEARMAPADEPAVHPALAALLAEHANEHATEPAAPRSALLQLQKQAATELGQDAAPRGATSSAAPGHELSLVNAPTARSMPALQTIAAGPILGAVRPAGSRVQSVVVNTLGKDAGVTKAGDAGDGLRKIPGTPGVSPQAATPASRAEPAAAELQRVALHVPGSDLAANSRDAVQPVTPASNTSKTQTRGPRDVVINVATDVPANAAPIGHSVVVVAAPAAVAAAAAAPVLAGKQDPVVIIKTAEDFLRQQATGLPGRVTLTIPPIAPRGLAACNNLQAFMAPGAPMWGRTTVGVRCTGEKPWTIYLLARISVQATYYVAGRSISPGDVIQMTDLVPREGDLSVMPRAIVTDPSQVIGAVAENRISAGLPLRSDLIRSPQAIQLGQTVKVVAQGDGFSISTDGNAMNNAGPGQQVRVKTSSGQMVVGTASGKGVVQIPM